jgi:hypothetical protein
MSAEMYPMDPGNAMDLPRPQCRAHNRAGTQCKNRAILGGTVCRMHGGAIPRVQNAAKLRLMSLIDPAIGVLATEMEAADSSADRQRAANSILDRAGLTRGSTADADVLRALIIDRLTLLASGGE